MDDDYHDEDNNTHDRAADVLTDEEPQPLVRVRYGLAKELRLYPDTLDIVHLEEHEETQVTLNNVRRLILAPGDPNPSKLVLMFDLDDGQTIIGAEGVSNVRDFRKLIAKLQEIHPRSSLTRQTWIPSRPGSRYPPPRPARVLRQRHRRLLSSSGYSPRGRLHRRARWTLRPV